MIFSVFIWNVVFQNLILYTSMNFDSFSLYLKLGSIYCLYLAKIEVSVNWTNVFWVRQVKDWCCNAHSQIGLNIFGDIYFRLRLVSLFQIKRILFINLRYRYMHIFVKCSCKYIFSHAIEWPILMCFLQSDDAAAFGHSIILRARTTALSKISGENTAL